MAIHFTQVEDSVRATLNEPVTGRLRTSVLVTHINDALLHFAQHVYLPKSRIVVQFFNGAVTLAESAGNIPETVGIPAYTSGWQGAFYIKYALAIDNIFPLINSGTVAAPNFNARARPLYVKRQEEIVTYTGTTSGETLFYAAYPYTYIDSGVSCQAVAVWLEAMFDYSTAQDLYQFEVHYRRWGPLVAVTYTRAEGYTYTQPYIYLFEFDKDAFVRDVIRRCTLSMGDKRYSVTMQDMMIEERRARLNASLRYNQDELPRIQQVDDPLRSAEEDYEL